MSYTLQLLHASDLEGGVDAIQRAPTFAALVEDFEGEVENTVIISAGDNYIPGPFYNAARRVDDQVFNDVYNAILGVDDFEALEADRGRIDISIMNAIGFDASAVGNHEFDNGPGAIADIAGSAVGGEGRADDEWLGALFPYLSANLDFSQEGALADLFTDEVRTTESFADIASDGEKIAEAAVIVENGERIGVVGATTQIVETITSTGDVTEETGGANNMTALAAELQPVIDDVIDGDDDTLGTADDVNKVILTTHLQQIALETELAGLLDGVDVIIAGGSDTRLVSDEANLAPGDESEGDYPRVINSADGETTVIVSTDGEYSYVGRLIVEFDDDGVIVPSAIDARSDAYAATDEILVRETGAADAAAARAASEKAGLVEQLTAPVTDIVATDDGETFGETTVFLDGRRSEVRTEETNLGNLTADANLAAARRADDGVMVSIKNGGGIRNAIGTVAIDGELLPPEANPIANPPKEAGEISQLDLADSLRFNNNLTLVDLSAADLLAILEHGVAETEGGATPGRFPQVGGVSFTFDVDRAPGDRVREVSLVAEDGTETRIVADGEVLEGAPESITVVTLGFLAGGGDGYDFEGLGENLRDIVVNEAGEVRTVAFGADEAAYPEGFAEFGEQQALAEFLQDNHPVDGDTPFAQAETPIAADERIVQIRSALDIRFSQELINAETPGAEIVSVAGDFVFVTNSNAEAGIDIFDRETGENLDFGLDDILEASEALAAAGVDAEDFGGVNSVAAAGGLLAVAYANATPTENGFVVVYDEVGDAEAARTLAVIEVGPNPDMVTFTPDGARILVANEGEPTEDTGEVDPEGSVSIIDTTTFTAVTADFTSFNGQRDALVESGVRLNTPGATVAQDLEPEYIAVAPDGQTAWVSLQENNAFAELDVAAGEITAVLPAGTVDFDAEGHGGLDANDRDDAIGIAPAPLTGLRQPDAIDSFTANGQTYYISANEGDARSDFGLVDEIRIEDFGSDDEGDNPLGVSLDPNALTDEELAELGRKNASATDGDTDGDGDIDRVHVFGTRSFTIFDAMGGVVFDSAGDLEARIADLNPAFHNANDGVAEEFDRRSDNKGPEPEAVEIGEVGDRTYAFIGMERANSAIFVYDVTDPSEAEFVEMIDPARIDRDADGTPDFASVEGLQFVGGDAFEDGVARLYASFELTGNTAVFEIRPDENATAVQEISDANPSGSAPVRDMDGRTVEGLEAEGASFTIDGAAIAVTGFEETETGRRYAYDSDGDGVADGSFDVTADFGAAAVMFSTFAAASRTETVMEVVPFTPTLTEGASLGAGDIRGIANETFLEGDGTKSFTGGLLSTVSALENSLFSYEVNLATGAIGNVRLLIANDQTEAEGASYSFGAPESGSRLGFAIAAGGAGALEEFAAGDSFQFVDAEGDAATVDVDGDGSITDAAGVTLLSESGEAISAPELFFSDSGLNPGDSLQVTSGTRAEGDRLEIGFEDRLGGDQDFNDVVIFVDVA